MLKTVSPALTWSASQPEIATNQFGYTPIAGSI